MKEIKAIIKPSRLEDVIRALRQIKDLPAMTVSAANGLSAEQGTFDQVVKTKLEIMVPMTWWNQWCEPSKTRHTRGLPEMGASLSSPLSRP